MPFFHFYESDDFDDHEKSEPGESFQYEDARGSFYARGLDGVAAKIYTAMMNAGATQMRVTYDGGNDEGFAHADDIWFGAERLSCDEAVSRLSSPEIMAILRDEARHSGASHWHNAEQVYDGGFPVKLALDELAHVIASALLGEGFGTGEYELYGALIADLKTGLLTDDPSALKP